MEETRGRNKNISRESKEQRSPLINKGRNPYLVHMSLLHSQEKRGTGRKNYSVSPATKVYASKEETIEEDPKLEDFYHQRHKERKHRMLSKIEDYKYSFNKNQEKRKQFYWTPDLQYFGFENHKKIKKNVQKWKKQNQNQREIFTQKKTDFNVVLRKEKQETQMMYPNSIRSYIEE